MDVASSIAGLIALAEVVICRGSRLIGIMKSAPKDINSLINEVTNLFGTLNSLLNVMQQLEKGPCNGTSGLGTPAGFRHVTDCHQLLHEAHEILVKLDTSGAAVKARMKWPFKVSEVERLISRIQRNISCLALAVQAKELDSFLKLLSTQDEIKTTLSAVKQAIITGSELQESSAEKKAIETKNIAVQAYYERYSPCEKYEETMKLRHPGTSEWFIHSEIFTKWSDDANSALWIYGIPGAGKTVLMSALIEHSLKLHDGDDKNGVAYWFCHYELTESQNPLNIFGSLLAQLSRQNDSAAQVLRDAHSSLQGRKSDWRPDLKVLKDLLIKLSGCFDSVLIFIDGLDECPQTERYGLLDVLSDLNTTFGTVKTLYASRNELDIQSMLHSIPSVRISASPQDIKLFVCAETEKRVRNKQLNIVDPELKVEIIETLVNRADGMFQWVICQLDYVCQQFGDEQKLQALQTLPPDLFSTYERILSNAYQHQSVREMVRRILIWVTYAKFPLNVPQLTQAIAVDDMGDEFNPRLVPGGDDIFKWCSSLLSLNHRGEVLFSHFTVKEYLMESSSKTMESNSLLCYFSPPALEANAFIARCCLKPFYMRESENTKENETLDILRQRYVAETVFEGASCYEDDDGVFEAIWKNFGVEGTKIGDMLQISKRCNLPREIKMARNCNLYSLILFGSATPLQWAASLGLPRLCKFLLDAGADYSGNPAYKEEFPGRYHGEKSSACHYIPLVAALQVCFHRLFSNIASMSRASKFLDVIELFLKQGGTIKQHRPRKDSDALSGLCEHCTSLQCGRSLLIFIFERQGLNMMGFDAPRSTYFHTRPLYEKRLPAAVLMEDDMTREIFHLLLRSGCRVDKSLIDHIWNLDSILGDFSYTCFLYVKTPKEYFTVDDHAELHLATFIKDIPETFLEKVGIELDVLNDIGKTQRELEERRKNDWETMDWSYSAGLLAGVSGLAVGTPMMGTPMMGTAMTPKVSGTPRLRRTAFLSYKRIANADAKSRTRRPVKKHLTDADT